MSKRSRAPWSQQCACKGGVSVRCNGRKYQKLCTVFTIKVRKWQGGVPRLLDMEQVNLHFYATRCVVVVPRENKEPGESASMDMMLVTHEPCCYTKVMGLLALILPPCCIMWVNTPKKQDTEMVERRLLDCTEEVNTRVVDWPQPAPEPPRSNQPPLYKFVPETTGTNIEWDDPPEEPT